MKRFEIKRVGDLWMPADEEIEHVARFPHDGHSTLTQIRYYLFAEVDAKFPGVYRLDWELEKLRQEAFARIDARSDELIASGFRFNDIVFSMSVEAQVRYAVMLIAADALSYDPSLDINSLDDREVVALHSPNETRMFCMTALNYVKSVVDSGTVQKNIVRAMTTFEEFTLYVDPR